MLDTKQSNNIVQRSKSFKWPKRGIEPYHKITAKWHKECAQLKEQFFYLVYINYNRLNNTTSKEINLTLFFKLKNTHCHMA